MRHEADNRRADRHAKTRKLENAKRLLCKTFFVFSCLRVFVLLMVVGTMAGCGGGGATQQKSTAPASTQPAAGGQLPSSIVDPYLKIQTALAQDRLDDVKPNADAIKSAADGLGAKAKDIDAAAQQLADAGEVGAARQKFGTLSDAIVAYMSSEKLTPPPGVRKAYCPMASKPWLQKGDTLANPYYGTSMPTCGAFQ
jgi:uncharacterized membrane protein